MFVHTLTHKYACSHTMSIVLLFVCSGRLLFVGYNDHTVRSWDVVKVSDDRVIVHRLSRSCLQGEQLGAWFDHQDRVNHVKVSPDGMALGSCSWDATIRVSDAAAS